MDLPNPVPSSTSAARPGVTLRFDLPLEALGFEPPPAHVQLRFLKTGGGEAWTLLVLVPAGTAEAVNRWIALHTTAPVTSSPGLAPRTLRSTLQTVPSRWQPWLTAARVVQADLSPDGAATLFVQGTTEELAALARSIGSVRAAARQRVSGTRPVESIPITPRQLEVLCNAVAMGYYDVPHRVGLRKLGQSMDLSVSAVSQLLRRAQGQIIRGFIDSNTLARGKRLSDQEDVRMSDAEHVRAAEADDVHMGGGPGRGHGGNPQVRPARQRT